MIPSQPFSSVVDQGELEMLVKHRCVLLANMMQRTCQAFGSDRSTVVQCEGLIRGLVEMVLQGLEQILERWPVAAEKHNFPETRLIPEEGGLVGVWCVEALDAPPVLKGHIRPDSSAWWRAADESFPWPVYASTPEEAARQVVLGSAQVAAATVRRVGWSGPAGTRPAEESA